MANFLQKHNLIVIFLDSKLIISSIESIQSKKLSSLVPNSLKLFSYLKRNLLTKISIRKKVLTFQRIRTRVTRLILEHLTHEPPRGQGIKEDDPCWVLFSFHVFDGLMTGFPNAYSQIVLNQVTRFESSDSHNLSLEKYLAQ